MGYGKEQMDDLAATIEATPCDAVIIATPIDLNRVIKINKPNTRVEYALQEIGAPDLKGIIADFVKKHA
jgi:predicted GTPase